MFGRLRLDQFWCGDYSEMIPFVGTWAFTGTEPVNFLQEDLWGVSFNSPERSSICRLQRMFIGLAAKGDPDL